MRGQISLRTAWLPPRSWANEIDTATLMKIPVDPRFDAWPKGIHLDGRSDQENPARPCICARRSRLQMGADQRSAQEHGLQVSE